MSEPIVFEVVHGDVREFRADVLALKYAQGLHGADAAVADRFANAGQKLRFPKPWGSLFAPRIIGLAASHVLFVGVPSLRSFGYPEIRTFGRHVLRDLRGLAPDTRHLAMTAHGAGYGLDEAEAFHALLAGVHEASSTGIGPPALSKVSIVELDEPRATRLRRVLSDLKTNGSLESAPTGRFRSDDARYETLRSAGYESNAKAHVFVAMPFRSEMEDVYHYAINGAVRSAGFICERADLCAFTGDVLDWVRERIKSAALVIADLTDANPNVYLEVGFAWGCGVPTVLLVSDVQHLKFDTRGQRCLVYKTIKDLEALLRTELAALPEVKQRRA